MNWIEGGGIPIAGLPLCGWPALGIPGAPAESESQGGINRLAQKRRAVSARDDRDIIDILKIIAGALN